MIPTFEPYAAAANIALDENARRRVFRSISCSTANSSLKLHVVGSGKALNGVVDLMLFNPLRSVISQTWLGENMQQVRTITPLQEEKLFMSCDNTQHEPTKSPSKEELGFSSRKKVKRESFSPELSSWTDDTKSALINEVMNFPQLWDVNGPNYKYRQVELWTRVVQNVNSTHGKAFTIPSAKAQWKNLRDTFIRKHREKQVKTRSRAADLPVKWRFYKEMKFLLSNADSGKRLCNVSAEHPGPSKVLREKGQQRSPVTRNTALDSVCDAVDGINDSRKRRDEFDTYGDYVAMMLRSISKSNRPAGIRLRHTITTAIVKCEADILTNEASEDAEESQLNGYHV